MRTTVFGATGVTVTRVSMGCNRLGDPGTKVEDWYPLVRQALEAGVTFFDTSQSYNQGRSEEILGYVTSQWRSPVTIATKAGVPIVTDDFPHRSFQEAGILQSVEGSLRRLRREAIDLYQLHSPTVEQLEHQDWAAAFDRLKRDGKALHCGISTSDHASGVWAIQHGLEFLQVEYNILDPTAEDELLPLALQHHTGIMVRLPLARGLLTGKFAPDQPIPPEQQWRRPRGEQLVRRLTRVEQLRFLERPGQTLAQAAIRFVLRHPAVHCAIPGARTAEQLASNVGADAGDLTDDEYQRIRALQTQWRSEGAW
ncbi:MAG: aldo/keto reductase [Chloroflexi bacterium]|nr:aldo/keto reductase [Chloroflexota bacterium]